MSIPLLNAPAGDFEALKAAVANGADAVYLGTKFFNARRLAKNFSEEDLKKAIFFAHLHGVKIYLTQNTLVKNDEINPWLKALEKAYLAGIDAVIIQDIFLVSYIKKFFPGLRVHASTQASFMNYKGINLFKDIDLVVLARELTAEEIKTIRQHTKTELEVFVHGHLCISYSGQCLISSLIGKRSGNRGICASSCRKEYNNAGYLISAKDLMLANHIKQIADLGINAIKIEGRMKSPEYVGITTQTYRRQLDTLKNAKQLSAEQIANLKLGFNREFTTGFFEDNSSIVGKEMPMNRGVYLGTVDYNTLTLEADLQLMDGISFWKSEQKGKLEGFILKKLLKNHQEITAARKGDVVVIPSRHFVNFAKVFLTSKNHGEDILGGGKLAVKEIRVEGSEGHPLTIIYNGRAIITDIFLQYAKKQALDEETIELELAKSSELGLMWNIKKYDLAKNLFLPNSALTKLRRALEETVKKEVVAERISSYTPLTVPSQKKVDGKAKLIVKVYSLEQIKEANATEVYAIYYDIFAKDVREAKKLCTCAKFFLDTPVIVTDKDIEYMQKIIDDVKPDGITVGNWGTLAISFSGEKHGKHSLNVFNDIAVTALKKENVLPTISVELNAKQVIAFANKEFIYYAHGSIPVMHFKGAYKEKVLTDEKNYTFKLRIVNNNTEMLYSRPIATFEAIKPLIDVGIKYFLLDLQRDTTTIITAYQNFINNIPQDISMLKKGTTLGNYSKGVA